jgi:transposase
MRGADEQAGSMFSYVSLEDRVPQDHPLRAIRRITDRAFERLSPRFDTLYVHFGRPSVPPEKLLRALVLQALYTIRSERQLMKQLDYNLLFRWFVGLGIDDPVWSLTTFIKNRDGLLDGDIAAAFFDAVLIHADTKALLSHEHFTVDGTLLEAWASHKSFRLRDEEPPTPTTGGGGNPTVSFHGQRRTNATHQSTTDPDARLYKKARGREARLGYLGHVVLEHRSGLIVDTMVTPADGHGERDAGLVMIERRPGAHRIHRRGRQGLRPARLCRGVAKHGRDAAHRPAHDRPPQHHRWAHHASSGVRGQSAEAQAGRARLPVDEDDRRPAQVATPRRATRRLDLHLHRRHVQHRSAAAFAAGNGVSRRPRTRPAPRSADRCGADLDARGHLSAERWSP